MNRGCMQHTAETLDYFAPPAAPAPPLAPEPVPAPTPVVPVVPAPDIPDEVVVDEPVAELGVGTLLLGEDMPDEDEDELGLVLEAPLELEP
ncbi:hypothetical protein [Noviherbaspirillum sp. Root189]|uniref:hypothetical protein n=1 Tax=Noviherbaspirillum sp. Root189 TaxID=1736487 RepID=UPI0012E35662|nr:hypothetical protein [Noviherbaspirillum sp. Root189]